mgnify:CR=1 FL=1
MKKHVNNQGITLIALVVTIIVLLILAGVSISMITGQNGILNRAAEAKEKTEISSKDEQRKLAQAEALMNTEKTTYKGVTLPEGFAPTKIDGEDSIDDGLVITDGYGNEYVWVEVPKTTTVYPTAGLDITEFTDTDFNNIEKDLHTYTNDYRNGTSFSDVYYPDSTTGWFADSSAYDTAKKKMLKSVYQNGGFWVGRYEAGIEINRSSSGAATTTPLSKANLYPYNCVTRTQAKVLAEQVESGSYTSSLMFGVQWDLLLKYIETKKEATVIDIRTKLNSNSSQIGNYYNSSFILDRGRFAQYNALSNWYDFNSDEKTSLVLESKKLEQSSHSNGILLTTGATEATNLQNMYDISGNLLEWTLEKNSDGDVPCICRGGSLLYSGYSFTASFHLVLYTYNSYADVGFRVSLY